MSPTVTLGAPGVYVEPTTSPPALGGVRMDVCAFLGVAPRGPVREPDAAPDPLPDGPTLHLPRRRSIAVPVESFGEYRRRFGGFEGPGRLPFAVAAFFEQGGRRAYVVRVVHESGDPAVDAAGAAAGALSGVVPSGGGTAGLVARSEGSWGNRLRAALGFATRPLAIVGASPTTVALDPADRVPPGTLLRLLLPAGVRTEAFVADVRAEGNGASGRTLQATLDRALAAAPLAAEVVAGIFAVDDGDGRSERFEEIGLSALHPRWLASVLCHESELLFPDPAWIDGDLLPLAGWRAGEPALPAPEPAPPASPQFSGGVDRYPEIVPDDFFDASWTLGDDRPGAGLHALVGLDEIAAVVLPDLYSPGPLVAVESVVAPPSLAGPEFAPCDTLPPPALVQDNPTPELDGLRLDPLVPADFETIVALQSRVVDLADATRGFVALLDVPPGLPHRRVLDWRARFRSSYAAAYHPWLTVARPDDGRDALIRVPGSAVAAGVIARRELAFGVPHGPFNEIAAGAVVDAAEAVSPARHAELHQAGVNVFLAERDGVRLTAGRTLSRDPAYRQLSVRRLMMLLVRALERETPWLVFEPNGPALWAEVRRFVSLYLRRLHRAGAFAGATENEAFFVRCDASLNSRRVLDAGQLIVEIGVAPAEPLEFLVVRLIRGGDGTLSVEA